MLSAILKGKAGRFEIDGKSYSWRDVFRTREDMLTAVFFGRLRYLSPELAEKIIEYMINIKSNESLGLLLKVEFWLKMNGVEGRRYVEPDVLLEFQNAVVMVEVKPPYGGKQSPDQWRNEIAAVDGAKHNFDYDIDLSKTLYFVALGNTSKGWQVAAEEIYEEFLDGIFSINVIEWGVLASFICLCRDECGGGDFAVLTDWIEAFNLFGITTYRPHWRDLLLYSGSNRIIDDWALLFRNRKDGLKSAVHAWGDIFDFANRQNLENWQWK